MADGVLVLDFDGTVCLGDEPMLAYAHEVAAEAGDAGRGIVDRVADFLVDGDHRGEPDLLHAPDGYQAAVRLGIAAGLDGPRLGEAYRRSRIALHAGELHVHTPPGLREVLRALKPTIRVVLVTNAPDDGIHRVLEVLGLDGVFDEVFGDARKPDGMHAILRDLLVRGGIEDDPGKLLSIGDIWRNDLEPAQLLGARTALIDRWGRGGGTPDVGAATFEELYPFIRDWAEHVRHENPT